RDLGGELRGVAEMLVLAAAASLEIVRTGRLAPVSARGNDAKDPRPPHARLLLDDLHVEAIARRRPRHERDRLGPRDALAAVGQLLDRHFHGAVLTRRRSTSRTTPSDRRRTASRCG